MQEYEIEKIYEMSIEELELSIPAFNSLKRINVHTVEELCNMTLSELKESKYIGRKKLDEILQKLEELGVKPKEENPEESKDGSIVRSKSFSCEIRIIPKSEPCEEYINLISKTLREKTLNSTWLSWFEKNEIGKNKMPVDGKITIGTDDTRIFAHRSGIPIYGQISLRDYSKYDIHAILESFGADIKSISLNIIN